MKPLFRPLVKTALILVYLVILAGATVRMTGSGMGCPDWPKCFGYYIPPYEGTQLIFKPNHTYKKGMMILENNERFLVAKDDFTSTSTINLNQWEIYSTHNYVVYNPVHTWIEYINRLIGALSGVPILIFTVISFWLYRKSIWLPILSVLTLLGMGFQAWLGKTVVDSNLAPFKITVHMVMALLIVAVLLLLLFKTKQQIQKIKYHPLFGKLLIVALILTLIQIILGTQVRQFVDEQAKAVGAYQKSQWLSAPEWTFYVHRSTALLVLAVNMGLWYLNKKRKLNFTTIPFVLACIAMEIITGILMFYFDFPFLSQPIHLFLSSLLFGLQFYMLVQNLFKKHSTC